MAQTHIVEANSAGEYKISLDGHDYEIHMYDYYNNQGFAHVYICDLTTGKRYESNGYIELNNHIFVSKWKETWDGKINSTLSCTELIIQVI